MLRRTPSLEAAEAFLVAARSQSFRAAAAELALSPSALSRRVQMLESFVGVALFNRAGPRPLLTSAGARYLGEIGPALDVIRHATETLSGGRDTLRLSTSHSFAAGWLMSRLPGLQNHHGLEVELVAEKGLDPVRSGRADMAICGAASAPEALPSQVLLSVDALVVGPPTMGDGSAPPATPGELGAHRLLAAKGSEQSWDAWRPEGDAGSFDRIRAYETMHLAYEAAASGLGVVLAGPLAVERFLHDGRLRPCMDERRSTGQHYRAVFADTRTRNLPRVRLFLDWLHGEIDASRRHFEAITA